MRTTIIAMAISLALAVPSLARSGYFEVRGVADGDMLKMRAGIGTGYRVILGLPNGTVVQVIRCEASGSVQWCKIALKEFRSVTGWVSKSYLHEQR